MAFVQLLCIYLFAYIYFLSMNPANLALGHYIQYMLLICIAVTKLQSTLHSVNFAVSERL